MLLLYHRSILILLIIITLSLQCSDSNAFNFPILQGKLQPKKNNVCLLTGATGRTGKVVASKLLEQGWNLKIFCRDEQKARNLFQDNLPNIEFCQGDLENPDDIEKAFSSSNELTHVIFMAGGEDADYKLVNNKGVSMFAEYAAKCKNIQKFVLISAAWTSRPFSIAALLFNSLYTETVPMASHFSGELALRQQASKGNFNYIILRAGGLNSDERFAKKYPEASKSGLTYEQGDKFEFLGIAGRPGMSRNQLANAVVSAANAKNDDSSYTVEVTASGSVGLTDSSIYADLEADVPLSETSIVTTEEDVLKVHTEAVSTLRNAVIAATIMSTLVIIFDGFLHGFAFILFLDALILFFWSRFFANLQLLENGETIST